MNDPKQTVSITNEEENPPGWPAGVPLPTLEEAEEAERQLIKRLAQLREEDKRKTATLYYDRTGATK